MNIKKLIEEGESETKFYIPEDVEKKLNERQRELIEVVKKKGEVALSDYKKLFPNFAERTLRNDLEDLVKHGVLTPMGERKGRRYILTAISAKYRQNIGKEQKGNEINKV